METLSIIKKYYKENSDLYHIIVGHSMDVMQKSLEIATKHPELNIDINFLSEAAMLHDIGINLTYAPNIECFGIMPYLCHGYLGRELLEKEGLEAHALVCERHIGIGLRKEDIIALSLPLPIRDMLPLTTEEKIISFADCFFSKTNIGKEKSHKEVREVVSKYENPNALPIFDEWSEMFL